MVPSLRRPHLNRFAVAEIRLIGESFYSEIDIISDIVCSRD